jgi:tripartite-type tricarboxylate transporter receptor subunit TctC
MLANAWSEKRLTSSDCTPLIHEESSGMSLQRSGRNLAGAVLSGGLVMGIASTYADIALASDAAIYPERPIRLIDAYPPGGGSGAVALLLKQKLSEAWGKQIVIDNRPGASGAIGTDIVARSTPNGYTLLMATSGAVVFAPLLNNVPFDTLKDFVAITQTTSQPLLVVLRPSMPINSVKELIAFAKAQPGKLTYSSAGIGGTAHLAGELLQALSHVSLTHVPYKGSGPALQAVVGGEVQMAFSNLLAAMPLVKSGRLKAIAVTTRARSLPHLPTLAEAGASGYDVSAWNGVLAPTGTPRPIIDKLHAEIVRALNAPDVKDKLLAMGSDPIGSTPEEFATYIREEFARWSKVIKDNNIREKMEKL